MPTLFLYILQASGSMALFYLLYIICFKKETFYQYNRILLLSAFVGSALLPLLPVPALQWKTTQVAEGASAMVYFNNNVHAATQTGEVTIVQHWWNPIIQYVVPLLLSVYIGVAILLLLVHVLQLVKINRLAKTGDSYTQNNIRYVQISGISAPFSFLRTVFFDPNAHEPTELQHILRHEEAHVEQYHSADMLLSAFYCCLCWINPFAWMCKRALQLNLEFLADEAAVQTFNTPSAYQYSLIKIGTSRSPVAIVNHFSKSFIKNRILMMNKTQSPRLRAWRYLMLLPVLGLTAGLLSATSPITSQDSGTQKYLVTEKGVLYGMVTRLTSDDDLADMKNVLAEKGITATVPVLKRNAAGEIINIRFVAVDRRGNTLGETLEDGPIKTFFFYFGEKESGIGEIAGGNFPKSLIQLAITESNGNLKGVTTDSTFLNRFPGGREAYAKTFAKNTRYPRAAQENNKVGGVLVQYKIQPSGAITDIEVVSTPDKIMGEEVKRVVGLLPSFKPDPAGKIVTVSFRASFRLMVDTPEKELKGREDENSDVIIVGYGKK
ncbi:M56 family metallopeptidase [Chitinophaga sp. RAB17]|uniref:M56 family metallopeptidase n=1 Tax=Chitinophaga sp. RAB17 TaxID=3233049 RepID=UPI003F8E4F60